VRPEPFFACSLPRSLVVVIGGLELVKGLVDLTLEIFPGVSRSRPEFPDFLFEVIGSLVQISTGAFIRARASSDEAGAFCL